jgi:AcrR family transcriptional regulator
MPRSRIIPDTTVFAVIHRLLDEGGDKAVSFATVATATGLAAPTLAQRYGTRDGMVRAARLAAWAALEAATVAAVLKADDKGPLGLLKMLASVDAARLVGDLRDPDLVARATAWRASVEAALAARLGTGQKAREAAALLFAAWQGQLLWSGTGAAGFRLKDAVKRLT